MNTLHLGAVYQSSNLNDTETKLEVYPLCLDVPIVVTGRRTKARVCQLSQRTNQMNSTQLLGVKMASGFCGWAVAKSESPADRI